jgi:adenine-specific DNA-methyltransferase
LHAPGETKDGPTGQPWRGIPPPKGRHWRYPPEVLEELDGKGLIEWSKTGNPRKKIFADEYLKKKTRRQDIWEFKDPAYPSYPTEKNLDMLKTIVEASSNPGDIVLDCFSGSGTTLVAAEMLGRRWIGMDNSLIAIEVSIRRLQKLKKARPFILYRTDGTRLPKALQKVLQ